MVWAEGGDAPELKALHDALEDIVFADAYRSDEGEEVIGEDESIPAGDEAHDKKNRFRLHVTLGRIMPFRWKQLEPKPVLEKKMDIGVSVESVELMESES